MFLMHLNVFKIQDVSQRKIVIMFIYAAHYKNAYIQYPVSLKRFLKAAKKTVDIIVQLKSVYYYY